MQLILGTAQWGSGYGITRDTGSLDDSEIERIMRTAIEGGIRAVDTHRAQAKEQGYGDAQWQLRQWAKELSITTKIYGSQSASMSVASQLRRALAELDVERIHAALVHDWSQLSESERDSVAESLRDCRERGLVSKIGVSGYDFNDVKSAQRHFGSLTVLQLPASPINQRIAVDESLATLEESGVEIHIRGVFAQGLLLPHATVTRFDDHPDIQRFQSWCSDHDMPPLEACLAFARQLPVDGVVVGVTSAKELDEILAAWRREPPHANWADMASRDESLIDPRRW